MNPIVLITGARRGLGKACAYLFASKGFDVVINDREDKSKLLAIKSDLEKNFELNRMFVLEMFQMRMM